LGRECLLLAAGNDVPARKKLGNAAFKPIEAAPGRYVKVRAE